MKSTFKESNFFNHNNLQYGESILSSLPIFCLEIDEDSKIIDVVYNSIHVNAEARRWNHGLFLNSIYYDSPLFLHFINKTVSNNECSAVLNLNGIVFEIYSKPNKSLAPRLKTFFVYLIKIHDYRQKFELSIDHQQIEVKSKDGSENEKETDTIRKLKS